MCSKDNNGKKKMRKTITKQQTEWRSTEHTLNECRIYQIIYSLSTIDLFESAHHDFDRKGENQTIEYWIANKNCWIGSTFGITNDSFVFFVSSERIFMIRNLDQFFFLTTFLLLALRISQEDQSAWKCQLIKQINECLNRQKIDDNWGDDEPN